MNATILQVVGAIVAPLAVGAAFRALAARVPADKRATINAATHAAVAGAAWYLSEKKLRGTAGLLARGAVYGEAAASAFAVAGPQILNATGAARFAGEPTTAGALGAARRACGLE